MARRIAALYGWDLDSAPELADPRRLLSEGYELLALDTPAVCSLAAAGIPFTTVEELLARIGKDSESVRILASTSSEGWACHHPDALTEEGVFWPELDHITQPRVWFAIASALLLVDAFRAIGTEEVRFLHGYPVHLNSISSTPSDVVARIWSRLLGDAAQPISLPVSPPLTRVRNWMSRTPIGLLLRWLRRWLAGFWFALAVHRLPKTPNGRAVLAMAGRELRRSSPTIDRICQHLGSRVVTIPWMDSRALSREAGALSPAPALPTPPLERTSARRERRLLLGVRTNLAAQNLGGMEVVRPEVTMALEVLARAWALHANRIRWLRGALRRLDARLVVATRLDLSYEGPIDAASHLAIPVLTLPHGIREWSPPARLEPKPGRAHVAGIRNPTAALGSMRISPDAFIDYEYPHRVRPHGIEHSPGRPFTILAVTDGFGGVNEPSTWIRTQAQALEWLADIGSRQTTRIRILVKPHPGVPYDEQFLLEPQARGALRFVPREADLLSLFRLADLVLGVNCSSTSLVHAVRAGLAVARLVTDEPSGSSGWLWEGEAAWVSFWDTHIPAIRDAANLDRFVDSLASRGRSLDLLREVSAGAAAQLVPKDGQERLVDIIDELLATADTERSIGSY